MDSHPADLTDWLSGHGDYSSPPGWRWSRTPLGVTVEPRVEPQAILFLVLIGFAVVPFVVLYAFHPAAGGPAVHGLFWISACALGAVPALILLILVVGLIQSSCRGLRGPLLTYSAARREFRLPRDGLVIPKARARCWRVVTGHRVGPAGQQRDNVNTMWELHLIADTADGPTAYNVCGWLSKGMTESIRDLAAATDLPVEFVRQDPYVRPEDLPLVRAVMRTDDVTLD